MQKQSANTTVWNVVWITRYILISATDNNTTVLYGDHISPFCFFPRPNPIRYKEITVMFYDYESDLGPLEVGRCKDIGYDSPAGGNQGISWTAGPKLMGPICAEQCHCTYGFSRNATYPSCKDQPDDPNAGKWCSLCGPKYNQPITIDLYNGDCRKQDNQNCVNSEPYLCSNGQCVHSKHGIYTKSGCAERCH